MANDAQIVIGADTSELVAALKSSVDSVKDAVGQMQSQFGGLGESFKMIQGAFLGISAVLAGGKLFKDAIESTEKWNKEVASISKVMGTSAESASEMNVALRLIGKSAEDLTGASFKLLKQIKSNEEGINSMGLKTRDANGHLRPMQDMMMSGIEVLKQYKEGADRDAAAMYLFGRSAEEVMSLQKLNTEVMAKAKDIAEKYGLVVGKEGVEQSKKYKMAQAELGLMWEGLQHQIGEALMPVLLGLTQWFASIAPSALKVFKVVLESVVGIFEGLVQLCNYAALGIAKVLDMMSPGKWTGKIKELEKNIADSDERIRKMLEKPIKAGNIEQPKETKGTKTFDEFGKGGKDHMAVFEERLAKAKVVYQQENDMREFSKQQEKAYWVDILNTQKMTQAERTAVSKKIAEADLEILKKASKDRRGLRAEEINESEKSALDQLKLEEINANRSVTAGDISKRQLVELQKGYEAKRYEIEVAAQEARIELQRQDPAQDPVALQAQLDKLLEIRRKHALDVAQLNASMTAELKAEWTSMTQPITNAFNTSISGMIQGTQTLKQATSKLAQSILASYVNLGIQKLQAWTFSEKGMTAISEAFSAMRVAIFGAEGTATVAEKVAEGTGVVSVNAAEAASGAAAAVAPTPFIGPGLAAAAFAGVMAMVLGAKSLFSAEGGFDIPSGVNPLVQAHAQEMILPAEQANAIREMTKNGGSGGDIHMHVHTQSVQDFKNFLAKNSDSLSPALRNLRRNFGAS